jgi:hypothetical protein
MKSLNPGKLALIALTFVTVSTLTPALNAESRYSVKIENASHYYIREMYLTSVIDPNWRLDLLGTEVLPSGYVFTSQRMAPGQYDLKLVDQDGDVCVVPGVPIGRGTQWRITDSWLLNCEGFH